MHQPSETEVSAILRLDGADRYEHFLKRVADFEELWSLWSDGWALMSDDAGNELAPVWPHACYAEICAKGPWQNYEPRAITLDAWLLRWIPGLERDNRNVAVFPTPEQKGVVVSPDRLLNDLQRELESYQ